MKIFISTSFSNKVLPDGNVEPDYRAHLEKIIGSLEAKGHTVFCAMREDGWRINNIAPGEALKADARAIKDCDLLIALMGNNPPSAGRQLELGIAYALQKRTIMLWHKDDEPVPYINRALLEDGRFSSATYNNLSDIPNLLETLVT